MSAPEVVAVEPVASSRRGIRLGLWAMILGIISPVWGALAVLFSFRAQSMLDYPDQVPLWPESLNGLVAAFNILGFIVTPVGSILALVFGIMALVRNRIPGKIMGGVGLLALLLSVGGIVALILWFFDSLSKVSG